MTTPHPHTEFIGKSQPQPTAAEQRKHWRYVFAASAMQGFCVSRDECGEIIRHGYEWIASEARAVADALLAELEKTE